MTAATSAANTRFSRPRFALLVLAGVYPLITGLLYAVATLSEGWPIWLRTMIIAPLMVTLVIWVVIPVVQARFRRFLHPPI